MLFNSAISKYILSHVFQFFCLSTGFCSTIDVPSPPKKNVIVSPLVTVDSPDSDNPHGGILHTPIKVKATINTDPSINKVPGFTSERTTYIIDRTPADLNKPYIATCFFGTTK